MLASCFKSHVAVFQSAFNTLQLGGWLEVQDIVKPSHYIDNLMFGTAFYYKFVLLHNYCSRTNCPHFNTRVYSSEEVGCH